MFIGPKIPKPDWKKRKVEDTKPADSDKPLCPSNYPYAYNNGQGCCHSPTLGGCYRGIACEHDRCYTNMPNTIWGVNRDDLQEP